MNQLTMFQNSPGGETKNSNQTFQADLPIHRWYQFVLGYPPHLVQQYLDKFQITPKHIVLDPFCGTGTTNVECFKRQITNYGIEGNAIACFASRVKTTLTLKLDDVRTYLGYICQSLQQSYQHFDLHERMLCSAPTDATNAPYLVTTIPSLTDEQAALIPAGFISPRPLQKVLIAKSIIQTIPDEQIRSFFFLSLANVIVKKAGNIGFGPEIYRAKAKEDIELIRQYFFNTVTMLEDLRNFQGNPTMSVIIRGDARQIDRSLSQELVHAIDCVITSPPYPNEKDYTRSTRLESVLLGFLSSKQDLRALKDHLLRSNSRNIFVKDHDGDWIADFPRICKLADEIEAKRIDLHKNSGFERLYHKIVRHYFGGMFLHLKSLKPFLSKQAKLAYVVGDQMSFFRIPIPTAELLAEIAESLGYRVLDIELWRRRLATATKQQIDENVLLLENTD